MGSKCIVARHRKRNNWQARLIGPEDIMSAVIQNTSECTDPIRRQVNGFAWIFPVLTCFEVQPSKIY